MANDQNRLTEVQRKYLQMLSQMQQPRQGQNFHYGAANAIADIGSAIIKRNAEKGQVKAMTEQYQQPGQQPNFNQWQQGPLGAGLSGQPQFDQWKQGPLGVGMNNQQQQPQYDYNFSGPGVLSDNTPQNPAQMGQQPNFNQWKQGSLGQQPNQGGSAIACFIGSTVISTPTVDKQIKDIRVGDKIISLDVHDKPCIEEVIEVMEPCISPNNYVFVNAKKQCKAGEPLQTISVGTTDTQPFLTVDGLANATAAALTGRKLIGLRGIKEVVSITVNADKEPVYDLKTTGRNIYFANGFAVKGRD
ncbi:hypothetical protein [Acetonema longum]|uniref:Hint domain-containing protein n=1 Tax=Acetonema longum DSM 6540 TaxID=1009370 RepID=F7NEI5_9FIRM|nr:hypothetical protein [Acetonema longum]EGO65396.1 hypothetical protein ALO_02241 [Acetonema longum DSM 6540]